MGCVNCECEACVANREVDFAASDQWEDMVRRVRCFDETAAAEPIEPAAFHPQPECDCA